MTRRAGGLLALSAALLLAAAVFEGCAGDGSALIDDVMRPPDPRANPDANLAWIQAEVFGAICIFCHVPGGEGPMPLTSEAVSFANLVDVPSIEVALDRVEPGDAEASYIVHKIEGRPTILGTRMPPPPLPMLSERQIQAIIDWIDAGAAP